MKGINRTLVAVGAAALGLNCAPAGASEVQGRIAALIVRSTDGLHYVKITGTPGARPACAITTDYYIIRDEHSDTGKAQLSMLLSAYMAGKPVVIVGTGGCSRWLDGEDIAEVRLL